MSFVSNASHCQAKFRHKKQTLKKKNENKKKSLLEGLFNSAIWHEPSQKPKEATAKRESHEVDGVGELVLSSVHTYYGGFVCFKVWGALAVMSTTSERRPCSIVHQHRPHPISTSLAFSRFLTWSLIEIKSSWMSFGTDERPKMLLMRLPIRGVETGLLSYRPTASVFSFPRIFYECSKQT